MSPKIKNKNEEMLTHPSTRMDCDVVMLCEVGKKKQKYLEWSNHGYRWWDGGALGLREGGTRWNRSVGGDFQSRKMESWRWLRYSVGSIYYPCS